MGKATGFLEYDQRDRRYKPAEDRVKHYNEFSVNLKTEELQRQASRCMDCGIPYCHQGCPVNNIIPDWNDLTFKGEYKKALEVLHSTNNFPEFTGRICPAPCQESCTLNLEDIPVTIKTIECATVDRAWENGWVHPEIAEHKTGKTVAVVGSGPAGMACAQQLVRAGHSVTLFEKNARIGGLLRYGIPDFKLEKQLIDRRQVQMEQEGVNIRTNVNIGLDMTVEDLQRDFDSVVLAGGSEAPRDLPVSGREFDGIHYAMDFLTQQNRRVADETIKDAQDILAEGKDVVVIGGGDTGSDCVGTSFRQGAKSVTQLEIMPKPPEREDKLATWPQWPIKLRTSTSHEEGAERDWSITTKAFLEDGGKVSGLQTIRVEWQESDNSGMEMVEVAGSEAEIKADLVLLAMGFIHPTHKGLIEDLEVDLDDRGNVKTDTVTYQTSVDGVFAAGDMRRGQSLVVWAIREGRQCARAVDEYLMGHSELPR